MRVGASVQQQADAVTRLVAEDRHVLVFEVAADVLEGRDGRARRCDVRLVGTVSGPPEEELELSRDDRFAAVLVLHGLTPSRLLSCLRALSRARVAPERPEANGSSANSMLHGLTAREHDVLRLLADGASTRDMAQRLSYSERTVKTIVHCLLAKLGCQTRAQAVALATRKGVI
jgi:DNA-binding CsgD family transcriptional regulator